MGFLETSLSQLLVNSSIFCVVNCSLSSAWREQRRVLA